MILAGQLTSDLDPAWRLLALRRVSLFWVALVEGGEHLGRAVGKVLVRCWVGRHVSMMWLNLMLRAGW